MAAWSMLLVLVFVDSLADAALAAGIGSSVAIIFLHPSSPTSSLRSLMGGHSLGLLLGSGFSLLLFSSPLTGYLETRLWFDSLVAFSVGIMILAMAATNTEHPPAVGTLLGIAIQPWHWQTPAIFLGAVILLSAIRFVFRPHMRDLL